MDLINYLQGHLKCEWTLRENSLSMVCDCYKYDFIQRVNELKPIEFIDTTLRGVLNISFNSEGFRDKSKIISQSNKH